MHRLNLNILSVAALGLFARTSIAVEVNAGYNAYKAAEVMIEKASHSWEWGTAAEALLELYNPELSVFSGNPFPGGEIPNVAQPNDILALKYARQFINRDSDVLVGDSAVGDPASLGVSALLLGQSDNTYIQASSREAQYLFNAPRWPNGAISHRPNVAELWADNMAMSFPFLAYLAVQQNNVSLMAEAVNQCSLYRDVLKANLNWRHIIGPESQDTGLWSSGNGWAAYGMTRVLHTLQKWPGSSSLGSQAGQLKSWIKEILDGAIDSSTESGLLRNYLNDNSWFGEVSGTAILSAVAYRMAVNDRGMFPKKYIDWADNNRKAVANHQGGNGIFAPAVNPYNWLDRTKYTTGSPEGQAFTVYLYTAYRDCVNAGVCQLPASTTISKPGIGPIDIITSLHAPITFGSMPDPTGIVCGAPQSCDADNCNGSFIGNTKYPTCQGGTRKGCQCKASTKTCGPHASCEANGCAGSFNGLGNTKYAQCTGNFVGCECIATDNTCGPHAPCDANGCAGSFNGLGNVPFAQCTGNFEGCRCSATSASCGPPQSCGNNRCGGAFNLADGKAYCTENFVGCECKANPATCGSPQSCDNNKCQGAFNGNVPTPQCTNFFKGCTCQATSATCGPKQSCDNNGCAGSFDANGVARCQGNFIGCECTSTKNTCGAPQNCDQNGCNGSFDAASNTARCRGNFKGCVCKPVPATCGPRQSCSANGCNGAFNNGIAVCTGNFYGCPCNPDTIWIPGGTNLLANYGCIVVNDSPRCAGNDPYHVSYQHSSDSSATIYAKFNGADTTHPQVIPGCSLQASWPSNYGDVYFGQDNCLYDSTGTRINNQCCNQPATTPVVNPDLRIVIC